MPASSWKWPDRSAWSAIERGAGREPKRPIFRYRIKSIPRRNFAYDRCIARRCETALKGYVDPYLEQDLVTAKCIKNIQIGADRIEIDVELGFPAAGYRDALVAALGERLAALGAGEAVVRVECKVIAHEVQRG